MRISTQRLLLDKQRDIYEFVCDLQNKVTYVCLSEKKVNENKYDISSQKRVTKTFLEVVVVQNNGKKMYKNVCYTSKVTFFTN